MFQKLFTQIKEFLLVSIPDQDKKEFRTGINLLNAGRGILTCVIFIFLEIFMLAAFLAGHPNDFLEPPHSYYGFLYILMMIVMAIFMLIFFRLKKNIQKQEAGFRSAAVFFVGFILLWCAAISLLDQLSYGQIIVYTVAVICVAVTPILDPFTLLGIYGFVHILFLGLMPFFQTSQEILFGNYFNGTAFVIISWAISGMRFKSHAEDFNNRRTIREKNAELEHINRELEEANSRLEKYSQIDSITGIFNRAAFDLMLHKEWDRCKRHAIPLSMFLIDVDYFKEYNDHYGHRAGDECLRKIAEKLADGARRSSDVVARYGGDEFAVLLPHIGPENALILAENMREAVEALKIQHHYSPAADHATISLGVNTITPSDEVSIEGFVQAADKALYMAKSWSRNRVASAPED